MSLLMSIFGDSLVQSIEKRLDKEVENRVEQKISKFIGHVSAAYDVSHRRLLLDFKNLDELDADRPKSNSGRCIGFTNLNSQCKLKSHKNGYCKRHQIQYKPVAKQTTEVEMQEITKRIPSQADLLIEL